MKLLLATPFGTPYLSLLDDLPGVERVTPGTPDELMARVADADAIWGWPTREQFLAARRVRWIQAPSAGVEMLVAIPELVASDVVLTNTRGAHARAIAEHAFAMLLALSRQLPRFQADAAARRWDPAGGMARVRELAGGTLGIVGHGQIGQAVARRAHAFELTVLAVDPEPQPGAPWAGEVWPPSRLGELLERSDAVVVAAPFTPRTRGLLGARELGQMKPDAYLIVVSRGGIVDEAALLDALREGRLAGAGLDVFAREPLTPDDPLWAAPNLIATPHLSGHSPQKDRRCVEILRENAGRFLRGEPLINLVDKRRGY